MNIKITTDSSADLSHLFEERNIPFLHCPVQLDGKEYRDSLDIFPQDIYHAYETKKILPKTAAPSPVDYSEFFAKHKPENGFLIHFVISSDLSLSYTNAANAAKEFGGVYVIDTRSLSSGIGFLALKAQDWANAGLSALEIVEKIEKIKYHSQVSFIVNNLEFLHKGGRCSGLQMVLAGILKIRPVLCLEEGKIIAARKYKFINFRKSMLRFIEETIAKYKNPDYTRIALTHTHLDNELIEEAKNLIRTIAPDFKDIIVTNPGATVTTHCGKGTLGLIFLNNIDE